MITVIPLLMYAVLPLPVARAVRTTFFCWLLRWTMKWSSTSQWTAGCIWTSTCLKRASKRTLPVLTTRPAGGVYLRCYITSRKRYDMNSRRVLLLCTAGILTVCWLLRGCVDYWSRVAFMRLDCLSSERCVLRSATTVISFYPTLSVHCLYCVLVLSSWMSGLFVEDKPIHSFHASSERCVLQTFYYFSTVLHPSDIAVKCATVGCVTVEK